MKNIVILGGWSSQKIYFERLITLLEKENNIYYFDFNNTNTNFEKAFINFIELNNINKFNLISWSMAGLVTLNTYENLQDKIEKIIFISSMSKFCKSKDYKIGWNLRIVGFMQDKLLKSYVNVLTDFNKNLLLNDFPFKTPILNKTQIECLDYGLKYLKESDFRELIKNINCPVLLIHGENDTIAPITHAEFLYDNLSAKKDILKLNECAHMPFYSHTEECFNSINNFLKGVI